MENKKGGWQMKSQVSNTGKRKAGRAADGNAAPGRRGGTHQGSGVGADRREGATHDTEHGDGPAGGWHRGNSLMPQRAFCRGTRWGWDLCFSSGWFTGDLWSLQELGWKPAVPRKSLPKLPGAFTDLIVQWQFCALGIWLIEGERNWGKLNAFHALLSVSDLQVTHKRQDSGSEWTQSEPWVSDTTMCHTGHESQILLLPGDAGATSHPPCTAEIQWDTQELIWKKRISGSPQCLLWVLTKPGPQLYALKQRSVSQGERRHQGSILGCGLQPGHSCQPGGAQPCQGSAAHASAHFLQVTQKSKMPTANSHAWRYF